MISIQPVPSYADVSESYTDPKTGKTSSTFNPVWLSWFLSLAGHVGNGLTTFHGLSTNAVLIGGSSAVDVESLGDLGNADQVLTSQGAGLPPVWANNPSGFANPMTTLGDIIVAGSIGDAERLPVGAEDSTFRVIQGIPTWTTSKAGRITGRTAAVASISAVTVGGSDSSYIISANVLVTTSTLHNFACQCTYTDEGGTARTVTFNFSQVAGTLVTAITNGTGAGPYEGVPLRIRAKASSTITLLTSGTFTTVTYNVEGQITQVT